MKSVPKWYAAPMGLPSRAAPFVAIACVLAAGCTHDFASYVPGDATDAGTTTDAKGDTGVDANVACTDTGAVSYVGHCYFAVTGVFDFEGAKAVCASKSAHLVTITSFGERDVVRAVGNAKERWIGLSRVTSAPAIDASYQWLTSEPRAGFADWSPSEPDGSGECVRLHTGLSDWGDDDCTTDHDALCERP
ncbi:hypothetical protein BH09MYX1_BH09MYX1_44540 [soil metagenome]